MMPGGHSTAPTSRFSSAPALEPRAWNAPTFSRPTAASSGPKAPRSTSHAADDVRVLVVGNPANTNALIARAHAPDIPAERFTAMMRLDHNRAVSQLANRPDVPVTAVRKLTIWGNHSSTQYPDLSHAQVNGVGAPQLVDQAWVHEVFIPTVAGRGAAAWAAFGFTFAGWLLAAIVVAGLSGVFKRD